MKKTGASSVLKEGYGLLPLAVLHDRSLSPTAKLMYALISSLCAKFGYCSAGNTFLAEKLHISTSQASRVISSLSRYLEIEAAQSSRRRIYLA